MKKLLLLVLGFMLISSLALGGTKTLTFFWQQELPSPNDLAGWRIYQSPTSGGPWTLIDTVPYTNPMPEYSSPKVVTVPDGTVTKLYYTLTAFDTSANESPRSLEVPVSIDFQSPSIPVQFTIKVTTP
jgi:hypothetical protein